MIIINKSTDVISSRNITKESAITATRDPRRRAKSISTIVPLSSSESSDRSILESRSDCSPSRSNSPHGDRTDALDHDKMFNSHFMTDDNHQQVD